MFLRSVELLKDKIEQVNQYPFSIPTIQTMGKLILSSNVTFLVGENGTGKSTLLEAIAYQCGFNTAGGGRNNNYQLEASGSALGDHIRMAWLPKVTNGFFLRAESYYNFASHIDSVGANEYYGGRSLHEQSHGESFFSLFMNRFNDKGIYLLDEPEAALSPARQLAFLRVLYDLRDTSQFIIATHSPIILGFPGAQILSFDHARIHEIQYEETEHYQITRRFLENKKQYLNELFDDEH
ncbi:AAA family ATPase [Paenibacillus crassostreae]|uniref:AAA family ATPase n=1 Tax=Paenibacillus crassostreae TaxID=1763538 RepID=A0A167FIS3_9BACL|nr:AAA family ATPase [Paenibacillus crassostreae]AOZ94363.1 AAA family ATPase [Paenibacillus crassostreae]OAB76600.1 AAA family ATPase [Paenibacillus crassostreae]